MGPNAAYEMANFVDPGQNEQSDPDLHSLHILVCPNT